MVLYMPLFMPLPMNQMCLRETKKISSIYVHILKVPMAHQICTLIERIYSPAFVQFALHVWFIGSCYRLSSEHYCP